MSWFDSKKLQTYAKSTLLQAQKQIDKVLDIKEEDFTVQSTTINVKNPSTGSTQKKPESFQETTPSTASNEKDSDFFSTYFASPTQGSSQLKSSSLNNFENIPTDVNFEEFLNQDVKSQSPNSDVGSSTGNSDVKTEAVKVKKVQKKQKKQNAALNSSDTSSHPATPNLKQQSMELEKIEKQNRVIY